MLFVDPESSEGTWLRTSLSRDITMLAGQRLETSVRELRKFLNQPFESLEIAELIRHCVHALSPGVPPAWRLDPRITTVLNAIRERNDLHISLESAAGMAFLSPSRFSHLFKQQVGLPFSRHVLCSISAADFADAAHLTRTFYQMVGMAPCRPRCAAATATQR